MLVCAIVLLRTYFVFVLLSFLDEFTYSWTTLCTTQPSFLLTVIFPLFESVFSFRFRLLDKDCTLP